MQTDLRRTCLTMAHELLPGDRNAGSPTERQRRPDIVRGQTALHRLLKTLPAGAYACDPAELITSFNAHALELWGRAPKLNGSSRGCSEES